MQVTVNDTPVLLRSQPLKGTYSRPGDQDDTIAEWAVPVEWTHTVPKSEAVWRRGMFANQNTVAKLRQGFTIEQVVSAFGLDD